MGKFQRQKLEGIVAWFRAREGERRGTAEEREEETKGGSKLKSPSWRWLLKMEIVAK